LLTRHKPTTVKVEQVGKEEGKQQSKQSKTQAVTAAAQQSNRKADAAGQPARAGTYTSPVQNKSLNGSKGSSSKGGVGEGSKGKQSLPHKPPKAPASGSGSPALDSFPLTVESILGPTPQELQDFDALW
jgi:hypothetical protein